MHKDPRIKARNCNTNNAHCCYREGYEYGYEDNIPEYFHCSIHDFIVRDYRADSALLINLIG